MRTVWLSDRILARVRLAMAVCAGWLWSASEAPAAPLPAVLGLVSSALLALVWVHVGGIMGLNNEGSSSSKRTPLIGLMYSLVPIPVQTAVGMMGAAMRSAQFVFEPVAAAVVFAVVFKRVPSWVRDSKGSETLC